MRPKLLFSIILFLLAVLAAWYWFRVADSDEARIRRTIEQLAEALNKTPGESAAAGLIKVKVVSDSFADPADITIGEYVNGSFSHENLTGRAMQYRSLTEQAKVAVADIRIKLVAPDKAQCSFGGKFSGRTKSGLSHEEVNDLDATLVKKDNRWKIQEIRFQKVLH